MIVIYLRIPSQPFQNYVYIIMFANSLERVCCNLLEASKKVFEKTRLGIQIEFTIRN